MVRNQQKKTRQKKSALPTPKEVASQHVEALFEQLQGYEGDDTILDFRGAYDAVIAAVHAEYLEKNPPLTANEHPNDVFGREAGFLVGVQFGMRLAEGAR